MILDRSDVLHDKYEMHCAVAGVRMPCVEAADIRAAMHNQVPSRALRYRAFSNQSHHYSNCFMLHTAAVDHRTFNRRLSHHSFDTGRSAAGSIIMIDDADSQLPISSAAEQLLAFHVNAETADCFVPSPLHHLADRRALCGH
jgi:hypothetical protein